MYFIYWCWIFIGVECVVVSLFWKNKAVWYRYHSSMGSVKLIQRATKKSLCEISQNEKKKRESWQMRYFCQVAFTLPTFLSGEELNFAYLKSATDDIVCNDVGLQFCGIEARSQVSHEPRVHRERILHLPLGRNSPIFLQFFYLFSIFFLNCF
jgi:hypothetical protein